jgi:hypothetical protein
MEPSKKNAKKSNINSTPEIFSEPDSPLTADLTEVEPDLTNSSPETLTEELTEELTPTLTPFTQVCQNIGISRETGYKRMEFLKIKPWKVKGKSFLDSAQVGHMNGLQEYYKEQGKLEGYPIPERTGPWDEEPEPTPAPAQNTPTEVSQNSALATTDSSIPALPEESEEESLSLEFSGQELIENLMQEKAEIQTNSDLEEVDSDSQDRAAKRIIAGETLTLFYEATENFTKPGLKDVVTTHRARCNAVRKQGKGGMQDFLKQKVSQILQKTGTSG